MMSSAAIANGAGVASGAVAVLQGIGATGAVPLAVAAATVAVPAAIGVGVVGVVKSLGSDKRESVSAYDPHDEDDPRWVVAIEKGPGNVRVVRFTTERDARTWFDKSWSMRVLYSPDGEVVASGGWNPWSHKTIRRVMKKYFAR